MSTRLFFRALLTFVAGALVAVAYSQQADEDRSPNSAHAQEQPSATSSQRPAAEQPSIEPHTQEALAFTGIVSRDKSTNEITLNDPVTKLIYKFDDPGKAQPYVGKNVKVVGKLGMNSNTIEISGIEVVPDRGKQ